MIIGGLSVWLRAIPERLWHWIVSQITMIVTVKDDDAAFVWVKEWFLEQSFLKRIRRVDLDTTLRNERIAMIPSPGKHWFWFGGRPFEVWFSRTDNTHERTGRRIESLTFRTTGRNRTSLQHFVDDVVQCHIRRQGVQSYLYIYNDGWDYVEGYSPRVLDSWFWNREKRNTCCKIWLNFEGRSSDTSAWAFPIIGATCFMGRPAQERLLCCLPWQRILDCRSTRSTCPISAIAV